MTQQDETESTPHFNLDIAEHQVNGDTRIEVNVEQDLAQGSDLLAELAQIAMAAVSERLMQLDMDRQQRQEIERMAQGERNDGPVRH